MEKVEYSKKETNESCDRRRDKKFGWSTAPETGTTYEGDLWKEFQETYRTRKNSTS